MGEDISRSKNVKQEKYLVKGERGFHLLADLKERAWVEVGVDVAIGGHEK